MTAVRAAFLNAWPVAAIGVSVAVNVAWIAGLGYVWCGDQSETQRQSR
jgi:hypothetical protein